MIGKSSIKNHFLKKKILDVIFVDIPDANFVQAKSFCQNFETKYLREHSDFYTQSNTSLLPDVFENFQHLCLEIYELDFAHFLSTPGSAWQTKITSFN